MKRALITGITGQVGSHMADLLLSKGYEVHGLYRQSSAPNFKNIAHIRDRIHLHPGDLCDQLSLVAVLAKVCPDEVYNFAAQSFVPASWVQPVLVGDSTGLGVTRLLEAVRLTCPKTRVYQASTSEMFGKVRETPQTELTPFHPRSPYGCAKAYGHFMVQNARESYGTYAVSGICFNCEGPRRGVEFVTRKISLAVGAIARGEQKELLLGNVAAQRDWGYVGDYVEAMWLTLQQEMAEDYVIATGVEHSVAEFCQLAFARVGMDWDRHVRLDPAFTRPAEVDLLVGDPRKIESLCGWKATTTFQGLVEMMVDADLGPR